MQSYRAVKFVTLGGVIAATLDIIFAFLFYGDRGVPPLKILQSISSGLLGMESYQGGIATAGLGLALHFFIAIVAAFIFYKASRHLTFLIQYPLIFGSLFGLCIYVFMNFLVLPLSAFPHPISFPPVVLISGLLVHMFLVGCPIAFCVKAASKMS